MTKELAYKPATYNTVSPYLIVSDAAALINFLEVVFGAKEIRRFSAPDSTRIMHAEVRLDDSILMLANSTDEWPPAPANMHVYVPDVDATYATALQAGATSLQEPVKKDDDDKRGGFQDAFGNSWWIGTKV